MQHSVFEPCAPAGFFFLDIHKSCCWSSSRPLAQQFQPQHSSFDVITVPPEHVQTISVWNVWLFLQNISKSNVAPKYLFLTSIHPYCS